MPGVKIVEEPADDLWFPPDQCVDPSWAHQQLAEEGYMGLGEYWDPTPHAPLGSGYGAREKKKTKWFRLMSKPPGERTAEDERFIEEAGKPEWYQEFRQPGVPTHPTLVEPSMERQLWQEEQWGEEQKWREGLPIEYRHAPLNVIEDIESKIFYLSVNAKTGYSFNIRIANYQGLMNPEANPDEDDIAPFEESAYLHGLVRGTCAPSDWCMAHCYAKVGHFVSWNEQHWYGLSRQQARYLQNLIVSKAYETATQEELDMVCSDLYSKIRERFYLVSGERGSRFPEDAPLNIRWNGGGDFNKGTIRVVNHLTEMFPDLVVWGFTRRGDTAGDRSGRGGLVKRPNLVMNVSVDPSSPWKGDDQGGRKGFSVERLLGAARALDANLVYATHVPLDPRIPRLRQWIEEQGGGLSNINTVFGWHCGQVHTEIGDWWECSATNPRLFGGCQECRWCMMSHEERLGGTLTPDGEPTPVYTPNQAFFAHGGEADVERIEEENERIEKYNANHPEAPHELIEPMEPEEVFERW